MCIDELKIYVLAEDYAGYNSPFWAQHGISFYIELVKDSTTTRIIFDTGSYAEPILHNAKILGLDLRNVDFIILSHSHFDHTGGLLGILKEIRKDIPIIAHTDVFKTSFITRPHFIYAGIKTDIKRRVEELGGIWILARDPIDLTEGVTTTGETPLDEREVFEKEITGIYKLSSGKVVEDYIEDEIGLLAITKKGLVLITGCSHPGIISMLKKAIRLTKKDNIYAIIGGFHLINASEERIDKTIQVINNMNVHKIYTGHCTGIRAECKFIRHYKGEFKKLHAGMTITIK